MDTPNFNLNRKLFRIHWHGYDNPSDNPKRDNDFYYGLTWVDTVNQFLEIRFMHGPSNFYIDYYEEWDAESANDERDGLNA